MPAACRAPAKPPSEKGGPYWSVEDPIVVADAIDPASTDPADHEKAAHLYRVSIQRDGETYAALWKAARTLCTIARLTPDAERKAAAASEARQHADRARRVRNQRVEGHYYYAISTGLYAETLAVGAIALVDDIEAAGKAAVRLDPAYDRAGPHLLLGELYFQAPAFPISIGDIDLAEDHLRAAVRLAPGYAPNRIALAELLLEDDREEESREVIGPILDERPDLPARWRDRYEALRAHFLGP